MNILHGDKVQELAVHLGVVDVVNGDDVAMVQGRGQLCLLNETRPSLGIADCASGQNFDGDFAAEPGIEGQVHFAHSAFTERRTDHERAEVFSGGNGHNLAYLEDASAKTEAKNSREEGAEPMCTVSPVT